MSERKDNTTEQDEPSRTRREQGSYYYDDATGYEIYDPAKDVEEEDESDPENETE